MSCGVYVYQLLHGGTLEEPPCRTCSSRYRGTRLVAIEKVADGDAPRRGRQEDGRETAKTGVSAAMSPSHALPGHHLARGEVAALPEHRKKPPAEPATRSIPKETIVWYRVSTNVPRRAGDGSRTAASPASEVCDVCGEAILPGPGESRFEATVSHFEREHVDRA
jgi:hypothetical protein